MRYRVGSILIKIFTVAGISTVLTSCYGAPNQEWEQKCMAEQALLEEERRVEQKNDLEADNLLEANDKQI